MIPKGFFIALFFLSSPLVLLWSQGVSVEQSRVQIPVLKHKEFTSVLKFRVTADEDQVVRKIIVEFEGTTDTEDIDSVFLVEMGMEGGWQMNRGQLIGRVELTGARAIFTLPDSGAPLPTHYIVGIKPSDRAPLDHFIAAGIAELTHSGMETLRPIVDPGRLRQRIGVAIRQGGDDGVGRYRIPGLALTNDGSLLAIYDVRRTPGRDLQGDIDIGVSRSTDGGESWEPMQIALDMGEHGGLPQKYNGVSDACILVDEQSSSIFIAGCWMHGVVEATSGTPVRELTEDSTVWNHQWKKNGSLPGYGIDSTSQFLIVESTDDGKSWGPPRNITHVKESDWHLLAPAPGSGITLDDGTLVFPTQGKDAEQHPFSNISYSRDGGASWKTSSPSYSNTTENMVVQLEDGSLMQNMRDNRNATNKSDTNGRAVFVTDDLGGNWNEHSSHHGALIEPVCMASIYKHEYLSTGGERKSLLLFSNPDSKFSRERMTIKVSFDEGKTWPMDHWLLLDELGLQGGYSSLSSVNNHTIGILYEGSQAQMTFERIDLEELGVLDAQGLE